VRRLLALAALAAVVTAAPAGAATPSPWKQIVQHKSRAGIDATLSFQERKETYGAYSFRDMQLVVKNGGKTVYDHDLCSLDRCGIASKHTLSLQNVWGGTLPEAVVDFYTGGAHCCFEALIVLVDGPHPGRAVFHNFGDPGYEFQRVEGNTSILSADDRFAYAFTAFAGSGLPLQIWTINANGVLTNITRTRPDLIKKDAAMWWHTYVAGRGKSEYGDVRGLVSAWCADEYLLGEKAACDAELKTALPKGYLNGSGFWPSGAKFVTALHRSLAKWGYLKS
jgi:hypothetical protein